MGRLYDRIDDHQRAWIARQPLFFVGTAPLGADGHVNLSPKGPIGTLRVLDDHTVAYLDVVGSGAETIAHLRENGRRSFGSTGAARSSRPASRASTTCSPASASTSRRRRRAGAR